MQVSVKNADVLASLLTDQSPITFSYFKNEEKNRRRGFWKFNNSLIEKTYLRWTFQWKHSRWSGKICTFNFPKLAKKANEIITDFETNFEHFKKHYVDNIDYNVCK